MRSGPAEQLKLPLLRMNVLSFGNAHHPSFGTAYFDGEKSAFAHAQSGFVGAFEHDIESMRVSLAGVKRCCAKLFQHQHKEFNARLKVGERVSAARPKDLEFLCGIPGICRCGG